MRLRKESENTMLSTLSCNLSVVIILCFGFSYVSGCYENERAALLKFKSMLTDPSNRLSSWHGQNCCSWRGIRCSESGYVINVDLRNPNPRQFVKNTNSEIISVSDTPPTSLNGTLSPSLFTLKHVRYLDLSYNNFMFSKIPSEISSLTELETLNLSNAVFKDSITTQLSNLTFLISLDLSCSHKISDMSTWRYNPTSRSMTYGEIESFMSSGSLSSSNLDWVQGLRKLEKLRLTGVDLSEASHSTKWAEPVSVLSNLRSLDLSNCKISGDVNIKQFLNLTNLQTLLLNSNAFNSPIPDHLVNLTKLSILDFSNCSIYGSIPYIPQLKGLYVGGNPGITVDLKALFAVPWSNLEELNLDFAQVSGQIPYSIANLTSLVFVSAVSCSITGPLHSAVTNLSKLQELRLHDNYISGQFPSSISHLKNVRVLSLAQNKLEGYVPETICSITNLKFLYLDLNQLTGSLPECLARHPNISYLFTRENKLTGTIPLSMFRKSNLIALSLGGNSLSVKMDLQQFEHNLQLQILELNSCNIGGQIPNFISSLTNLTVLILSNNNLSGSIPTWLLKLPKLSLLDLSKNKLEGVIPRTIQLHSSSFATVLSLGSNKLQGSVPSQFKNVRVIDLWFNNFTGTIPYELGKLRETEYISLSRNNLSGEVPSSFCESHNVLMVLDLSHNRLNGTIKPRLGRCTSLQYLDLRQNKLDGTIPEELAGAKSLRYLDLNGNYFRGPFPRTIQNLKSLESLDLADNRFEGKIPQFIGDLQNLRILNLASNSFNESIPQELMKLEKLQYVSFSNNRLSGSISDRISGLKMLIDKQKDGSLLATISSMAYIAFELEMVKKQSLLKLEGVRTYDTGIDLSLNFLTGKIPDEICLLKGLAMLNISHNALTLEIPGMIGEMSSLESLDLSFNNLSGEIPVTLTNLDALQILILSYNNLSGKVPTGPHFDTLSIDRSNYAGNKYLCDVPGGMNCGNEVSLSSGTNDDEDDDNRVQVLIGIAISGYVTGLSMYFGILFLVTDDWRDKYWRAIDQFVMRILNYKQRNMCYSFSTQ